MKKFFTLIAEEVPDAPANRTHYRSKLYTSKMGVNPLVAAAHPIFSILERINLSEKVPELSSLQENLWHELQAFMAKAHSSERTEEMILAARYLLCATIDEVIDKAYHENEPIRDIRIINMESSQDSNPSSHFIDTTDSSHHSFSEINQSFSKLENAIAPDVHVFQILDKAMIKPNFYLDIIELAYFCIITGFEGKYRNDPNGKQSLENLLDKLYQIIQEHKPALPEKLFTESTSVTRFLSVKPFPWKWFIGTVASVIVLGYVITTYELSQQATEALKVFNP